VTGSSSTPTFGPNTLETKSKKKLSIILNSHHIHQHKINDKFGIKKPIHIEHLVCF